MATIIPAIIPHEYQDISDDVALVKDYVSLVQVDVIDGVYAPEASWPYNRRDAELFAKLVEEKEGLPFWELIDYEIDMMVEKPEEKMDDWISAGAKTLIIHLESTDAYESIFTRGEERGVEIALALKPSTDNRLLAPWIHRVAYIQCMGNDHIGFHGVSLDESVVGKIQDLRALYGDVTIGVDIGVSGKTAPLLIEAGATRLAAGSAIYESDNIAEAIKLLGHSR